MTQVTGTALFPTLFTAKAAQGSNDAKFSISVLIAPGSPQVAVLQAQVDAAKAKTFPNGYTGANECFGKYEDRFAGKSYYDARFKDYYVFSCSAKEDDRPIVVDLSLQPVIDASEVFSGVTVTVNAGMSGYVKGRGGVGGWLNGVQIGKMGEFGRLDGKQSAEQMFGATGDPQF